MNAIIILMVLYFMASPLIAQPDNMFVNFINYDDRNDVRIYDAYDAGDIIALTGDFRLREMNTSAFWLGGMSPDGNVAWQETFFPADGNLRYCKSYSVIQTDDAGFVMGGDRSSNDGGFSVLKVNADREVEWWRNYGGANSFCRAVIELKSGEILAAGYADGGYAVKLDQDGDVIWEQNYNNSIVFIDVIRETEGGYIFAGGNHALKVDHDGDIIWERQYDTFIYDMISCPEWGFALCGLPIVNNRYVDDQFALLRIRDDGRQSWVQSYELEGGGGRFNAATGIARATDGGFTLVGFRNSRNSSFILHTDRQGNESWQRTDSWGRSGRLYSSIVIGDEGYAYVVGACVVGNRRSGVVVKIVPDSSPPRILSFIPTEHEFSVLSGDSMLFAVYATDLQDDSLMFVWTVDEDSIASDTSTTIIFDDLGDINVKCVVSDGELADSVQWLVHVEEFYIDSYSPDSLAWTVRRPYEADFSLGIRAIEGVEPRFRWILTDREHRQVDVGNEAELNYTFDIQGNYSLEGRAFYEDTEHSVIWQVAVNSVLYWWRPHERQLEANIRQEIEFSVIPFNPDSDSLEYLWLIDGEDDGDIEDGIFARFNEVGEHHVTPIVHDGVEVDTVVWTITVNPNAVDEDITSLLPTEVTLYPAAPNPFNSTTSIRYFLPRTADVRLTVYDSAGRLVQRLSEGFATSGEHSATVQGAELPAGVYLLRLETGGDVRSMKVVLLK